MDRNKGGRNIREEEGTSTVLTIVPIVARGHKGHKEFRGGVLRSASTVAEDTDPGTRVWGRNAGSALR